MHDDDHYLMSRKMIELKMSKKKKNLIHTRLARFLLISPPYDRLSKIGFPFPDF
jgi:hypothetical protein